jgi:PIN domain nuclease of toxin-antitoxin system
MDSSPKGAHGLSVSSFVLDASALLVLALDEPGADIVEDALTAETCLITSVNLAEAASRLVDLGFHEDEVRSAVRISNLEAVALSPDVGIIAGLLRHTTRAAGLSIGDRCCIALAQALSLPLLTADRVWLDLDLGVRVELCR